MSVTIVGGGVSGLATALAIAKESPYTTVNIIEKSARLGGWVDTRKIIGHLFETGPRTLRPVGQAGTATLDLICQLNLQDQIVAVPKSSPSAKNRFIMTEAGPSRMPATINEYLMSRSSILKGTLKYFLKEPFIRPTNLLDESVHSFVSRRLGSAIADNMISAIIHGIYAGDTRQLSVKSTLGFLWKAEKEHGSITRGILAPSQIADIKVSNESFIPFVKKIKESALYSFKDGLQTLTDALVDKLSSLPNIHLHTSTDCTSICLSETNQTVTTRVQDSTQQQGRSFTSSRLIVAIPPSAVSKLLICPKDITQILSKNPSVTVTVTNLVYESSLPLQGFGVLVPRPQVSNTVLGIVFDSCAVPFQNSLPNFTRLSVMSGGWAWDPLLSTKDSAIAYVERTLGLRNPIIALEHVQRDCIPQYLVGHSSRIRLLHKWLENKGTSFVGCGYGGVSVNDCIRIGGIVGTAVGKGKGITGLEEI